MLKPAVLKLGRKDQILLISVFDVKSLRMQNYSHFHGKKQ